MADFSPMGRFLAFSAKFEELFAGLADRDEFGRDFFLGERVLFGRVGGGWELVEGLGFGVVPDFKRLKIKLRP